MTLSAVSYVELASQRFFHISKIKP